MAGEAFDSHKTDMLHELFTAIDTDGDGHLSFAEFTAALDSNVAIRKLLSGDGTEDGTLIWQQILNPQHTAGVNRVFSLEEFLSFFGAPPLEPRSPYRCGTP